MLGRHVVPVMRIVRIAGIVPVPLIAGPVCVVRIVSVAARVRVGGLAR